MKKLIVFLTLLCISLMIFAQEPRTRTKREEGLNEEINNKREKTSPEIILSNKMIELFEKEWH